MAPAARATTWAIGGPHRRPLVLPVQNAGTGLTGTYFANGTMAGAPVLRRVDAAMDFNWGKQSPGPGLPADNFSVRWEGLLAAPGTGSYRFVAKTGDEVRLWINGKKILDTWKGTSGGVLSNGNVGLAAGEKTTIKIEFAEGEGDAQFQLLWAPPGQAPQLIPTTSLYPLGSPTTPDPPGTAPAPKPVAAKPTPKPAAPKPAAPAKPVAVAKAEVAPKPAKAPAQTAEQAAAKAAAAAEAKAAATKAKAEADAAKATAKAAEAKAKADKAAAKAAAEAEAKAKKDQQPEPLAPGVYVLTSRTTGKPLEVIDPYRPNSQAYQPEAVGAAAGGALARSTAPQWKIESLGGGFYRLVVPGNNRVLEVLGSSTSNGADLDLWPYYSGNNQAWRIEPTEGGYYKLLAKHSNKALTAKDSANVTDGGLIHQWRFSGRENQMWKLQPVQAEEPTAAAMAGSKPGVGAHKMSIYPNPSNGVVQLRYELPEELPMGWVLYNQNGAPVRVSDYRRQPAGPHHQTLDFTGLPAGDYNLRMTVGTVTTREQLQLRNPKADVPTPSGN